MSKVTKLVKQVIELRLTRLSLENGVKGSMYNPSDSDLTEGRICFSDIESQRGFEYARTWARLGSQIEELMSQGYRLRGENRKQFIREVYS